MKSSFWKKLDTYIDELCRETISGCSCLILQNGDVYKRQGSGCIAISLVKLGEYRSVTALDISKEALKVAEANRERILGEEKERLQLIKSDMFEGLEPKAQFDVIVSNPPYIPSEVIEGLEPEVRDHEPRLALDGEADGLKFYRILAERSMAYLKPGGKIYMEIGFDQDVYKRQQYLRLF